MKNILELSTTLTISALILTTGMIISGRYDKQNYSTKVKASLYDSNWAIGHSELQYEGESEPL